MMSEYCPDNYSVWKAHECAEAKQEAWEYAHLPECMVCGEIIEDDEFFYDDEEDECCHLHCSYYRWLVSKYDYLERFR